MTQTPFKSDQQDHSLSSFFTGTIVGAVIALTLGTEDGRKFAKNLAKTVKYLGDELGKQAGNISEHPDQFRQQTQTKINDFAKSVQEVNQTIQHTGQQVIGRLHRDASDYFNQDGKPLNS